MSNLNLDLEKIQSVVASEASRAVTANNKRIIALVKQFAKDLIDAINEGAEVEEEAAAKPAAKKPAKEDKPAKPAKEDKPAKKAKEPEPEEDDGEEGDSVWDLLDEVSDAEIEDSEYMKLSEAKLKKELKERGIDDIPDDAEKVDLIAALILIDEDEEGEEEE
jgi:ribosomal protein L12E/L44/L45/RPP1/RPP2